MPLVSPQVAWILQHPGAFALRVMRAFRANQGLLLAGAVAYYTLLSIVPLLILMVIALSHVIDQAELLETLRRALEHVVPGQGGAVVQELAAFLEHRDVIGWVLLATMIFFSSLAFKVLENAISVIFLHHVAARKRHFLASALLPFAYIVFLGVGLFIGTLTLAQLIAIGEERLVILGHSWSLGGFTRVVLYLASVASEIAIISAIYYFMPVGRISLRLALIGGATAGLLWEIIRHALAWYLATFSQVSVVYGSLTTAIIVLLSLEVAAALLLLGAQVMAEYERIGTSDADAPPATMRTD
ncbi:MAG TPA: YihY/virulence factor BrkB family protein [Burkholderiales bacterium]|nr:YihY/virulence factor BrkB family protein [Burkholderiales bacterium]